MTKRMRDARVEFFLSGFRSRGTVEDVEIAEEIERSREREIHWRRSAKDWETLNNKNNAAMAEYYSKCEELEEENVRLEKKLSIATQSAWVEKENGNEK